MKREQIEFAAKAAKLQEHGWMSDSYMHVIENTWAHFNPMDDDGQALRLALDLSLVIMPYPADKAVRVTGLDLPEFIERVEDGDFYKAARLAIVKAAAYIGSKMP